MKDKSGGRGYPRDRVGKLKRDTLGRRIQKLRMEQGVIQADIGKAVDLTRTAVAQWERDDSEPSLDRIQIIAKMLKTTPQYIAFGITSAPKVVAPDPDELGYALVEEVTFGDGTDNPVSTQTWGLPTTWLRGELQITDYTQAVIVQSPVDTEKFGYGDRVVVDRGARRVSPPGMFLHWDGQGPMISQMSLVPGDPKKPKVKVSAPQGAYELDLDKVQVIGRVRGVWART